MRTSLASARHAHSELEGGSGPRRRGQSPATSKTSPTIPNGSTRRPSDRDALIPEARSEGLAVPEELAISPKVNIIPRTTASKHNPAPIKQTTPAATNQRDKPRVCDGGDVVGGSYGLSREDVMNLSGGLSNRAGRTVTKGMLTCQEIHGKTTRPSRSSSNPGARP